MFGKFGLWRNDEPVASLGPCKVRELLCYLLIHRDRPQPRETLASLLWGETSTAQARKYLRQALWQLQLALGGHATPAGKRLLVVGSDWVQFNTLPALWLDVAVFEDLATHVQGLDTAGLDPETAQAIEDLTGLYRGDLLEGWYQDWCLYERERLRAAHLTLLDRLVAHHEEHGAYAVALAHGMRVLQLDPSREVIHQRVMRLQYLVGDRAGALRQFGRCVAALRDDLDVEPLAQTVALHEQIRAGLLEAVPPAPRPAPPAPASLAAALGELRRVAAALADAQHCLARQIQRLEADAGAPVSPGAAPLPLAATRGGGRIR